MRYARTASAIAAVLLAAMLIAAAAAADAPPREPPWAFAVMANGRPGKYVSADGVPGFKEDLLALKAHYVDRATRERPAPEFLLLPGNFDDAERTADLVESVLGKGFPSVHVLGLQETTVIRRKMLKTFDRYRRKLGFREGPPGTSKYQYSFTYKNLQVVVMNVYWSGKPGRDEEVNNIIVTPLPDGTTRTRRHSHFVPASLDWLARTLAASDAPHKVVLGHEPAWPFYGHSYTSLAGHTAVRDRFWKILGDAGVQIYFPGASYYYQAYRWLGHDDPHRWGRHFSEQTPGPVHTWQIDAGVARGTVHHAKRRNTWPRSIVYCVVTDDAIEVEILLSLLEAPGRWGPWHVPENGVHIYDDPMPRTLYKWSIPRPRRSPARAEHPR